MRSKEHSHPQWKTKVCLFDEVAKTLTGPSQQSEKCVQVLWNLGEEARMYILFPSMFPRMSLGYTCSLGFWVKLGFAIRYEVIVFLRDWTNCVLVGFAQGYKLCNKECKEMKQTWKNTTHKTKTFLKLWSFLHNHRKLDHCLLWPWLWKANPNLASELQWDLCDNWWHYRASLCQCSSCMTTFCQ